MQLSFRATRNISIGVLISLILASSFFSLINVKKISNFLTIIITEEKPVLDKLEIIHTHLQSSRQYFENYKRRDKIDIEELFQLVDHMINKIIIPEGLFTELESKAFKKFNNNLKQINEYLISYANEETQSSTNSVKLEFLIKTISNLIMSTKAELTKISTMLNARSCTDVNILKSLDVANRLLSEIDLSFKKYISREIIPISKVLIPLNSAIKEISLLQEKVPEDMELLKKLLKNTKVFKIAILGYVDEEEIDPSCSSAIVMETKAISAKINAITTLNELREIITKKVNSSQNKMLLTAKSTQIITITGILFGILIALIVGLFMNYSLSSPIQKLLEGTEKLATGDLNTKIEINSKDEFEQLANAFNKMSQDLKRNTVSIHDLNDVNDQFRINEQKLKSTNQKLIAQEHQLRESEALLKLKIDDMKRINKLMMERESRVIEIKREVNELCKKLGLQDRYTQGLS